MACKVDFTGKSIVFITGASKGLGRTIAIELSKLASDSVFVLIARSKQQLEETSRLISGNVKSLIFPLDLSKATESDYENLFSSVISSVDLNLLSTALFLHNAGSVGELKLLTEISDLKTCREYFDLNLFSVMILTSVFYRMLNIVPKKVLVNITSLIGRKPFKTMGFYGIGKAARDFYFKVLAEEHSDLVILNYSPGPVDTEMFHSIIKDSKDADIKNQFIEIVEKKQLLTAEQTMKKMIGLLQTGNFKSGDTVDYYDRD